MPQWETFDGIKTHLIFPITSFRAFEGTNCTSVEGVKNEWRSLVEYIYSN